MPFVTEPTARPIAPGIEPPDKGAKPSFFGETVPAAFRLENVIGSTMAHGVSPTVAAAFGAPVDGSFDPFADPETIKGYEGHEKAFIAASSEADVARMKAQIDSERADRETLSRAGIPGFVAAMGAGILDPTILIPVGGQLKKGETFLKASGRIAAAAGFGTAVQEAGLQSTQELRTAAESALNIGGSVLLGAALGGAVHGLTKADFNRMAKQISRDMQAPGKGNIDPLDPHQSLSGAHVPQTTMADESIDAIEAVAEKLGIADPVIRLSTSPSLTARKFVQSLAEGSLSLRKNAPAIEEVRLPDGTKERRLILGKPTAQAVESNILRKKEVYAGRTLKALDDAFIQYRTGKDRKFGDIARATLPSPGKLSRGKFHEEVVKAARRGDAHDIPEVDAAAKKLRAEFFDPLKEEAKAQGMFGFRVANPVRKFGEPVRYEPAEPNVGDTAESYVPRLYDRDKIVRNESEFVDELTRYYVEEAEKSAQKAADIEFKLGTMVKADIDGLRTQAGAFIRARRDLFERSAAEVEAAKKKAATVAAKAKEAVTQAGAAEKRLGEVAKREEDLSPEKRAYFLGLLKDLKRGRGDVQPESLTTFIRRHGGISDWESMGRKEDLHRTNLINQHGNTLDYHRELAVEAGFVPEDIDLNQFVDIIREDLGGSPVVRSDDIDHLAYNDWLSEMAEAAAKEDIDVHNATPEEFASYFESAKYAEKTQFQKGRIKEAELRERYAFSRLDKNKAASEMADHALHEATVAARTLRESAPELTERINEYRADLKRARSEREKLKRDLAREELRAGMSEAELRDVAVRTKQRILSGPAGRLSYDGPSARGAVNMRKGGVGTSGRFKARKLGIRDEKIERFLENDVERIVRSTVNGMVPEIELTKRFGSVDLEMQFKELRDDFERMNDKIAENAARPEGDELRIDEAGAQRQRLAVDASRKAAERDIVAIRDRLLGHYGVPDDPNSIGYRAIRATKTFNHLRLMGGVTLSSIPDVARVVFANGVENFMGPALHAFTGQLSKLKLAAKEVKNAGPGFELVNNTRIAGMSDLFDDFGRSNKVERGLDAARANFAWVSLIGPWNHVMKTAAGLTVQNRILRAVSNLKRGRISKKDAIYLSRLGIGQEDALSMAAKFREVGAKSEGVWSANTEAWNDPALAEVFHNAMRKEIDRIIVTPGQEKPLFMSGPLGSLFGQFRSYNFAATQRVMLAGMQGMAQGDMQALSMFTTQIALGMIVAKLKVEANGVDTSEWTPRKWLVEGIDRSGIMGVLTEVNMVSEHLTRGRVGLSALSGQGLLSRFHSRNLLGALLGPSAGAIGDFATATGALTSGEPITEGDIGAMRRLLPYQNLIGVRNLFDAAEAGLAAGTGA